MLFQITVQAWGIFGFVFAKLRLSEEKTKLKDKKKTEFIHHAYVSDVESSQR